ncbi:universal stress protein [Streptomyces sp. NPDC002640]
MTVGVNGSTASLRALDWAVDEASLHRLPLRIVHASLWERFESAVPGEGDEPSSSETAAEREIVRSAQARARVRQQDTEVRTDVLAGDPVEVLVEAGGASFALVVGHREHGSLVHRLTSGSTAAGVAHHVWCPFVVVGAASSGGRQEAGPVVLGVDADARPASAHVAFALQEARARGCELVAVHALPRHGNSRHNDEPATDALLNAGLGRAAAEHGVVVRAMTQEGHADQVLARAARHADLLVLGTRHRHGALHLGLGPVHHFALLRSPAPVALVPHT